MYFNVSESNLGIERIRIYWGVRDLVPMLEQMMAKHTLNIKIDTLSLFSLKKVSIFTVFFYFFFFC